MEAPAPPVPSLTRSEFARNLLKCTKMYFVVLEEKATKNAKTDQNSTLLQCASIYFVICRPQKMHLNTLFNEPSSILAIVSLAFQHVHCTHITCFTCLLKRENLLLKKHYSNRTFVFPIFFVNLHGVVCCGKYEAAGQSNVDSRKTGAYCMLHIEAYCIWHITYHILEHIAYCKLDISYCFDEEFP